MKAAVIGWTERVSLDHTGREYGALCLAAPMPEPRYPGSEFFADEAQWAAEGEFDYLVPMDDPVWVFIERHEAANGYEAFALLWGD